MLLFRAIQRSLLELSRQMSTRTKWLHIREDLKSSLTETSFRPVFGGPYAGQLQVARCLVRDKSAQKLG